MFVAWITSFSDNKNYLLQIAYKIIQRNFSDHQRSSRTKENPLAASALYKTSVYLKDLLLFKNLFIL